MVQWSCLCLNVTINTTTNGGGATLKKISVSEIGFISDNPFEGSDAVYDCRITLEGPQLAMESLLVYKEERTSADSWTVLRCCNCDLICFASSHHSDRVLINQLMIHDPKEITKLRADFRYSSFYKLILCDHDDTQGIDLSTVYVETKTFRKFEQKIDLLKDMKEEHLTQEKIKCEECIRVFAVNQRSKNRDREESLNHEFDKLMTAHFKANKHMTDSVVKSRDVRFSDTPANVKQENRTHGTADDDNSLNVNNRMNAVDDFEDDLDVFNAFGEFDDLDPMAANSSDGGDDSPRSSSDGSNTEHRDRLTDIPRYDGKDKQRNGAAKISCSMPIPMNNNWGGRVPQKDIEVIDEEEINIAKSIKELAKSVRSGTSTDVFGGLPRSRLASWNIDTK